MVCYGKHQPPLPPSFPLPRGPLFHLFGTGHFRTYFQSSEEHACISMSGFFSPRVILTYWLITLGAEDLAPSLPHPHREGPLSHFWTLLLSQSWSLLSLGRCPQPAPGAPTGLSSLQSHSGLYAFTCLSHHWTRNL